ncbi:MAG: hypothetical protein M3O62_15635 [Pseudomonadota bacterium]|nr:hypothetical protein [Pseudomonadota bacterium]
MFLYDAQAASLRLISHAKESTTQSGNANSSDPVISTDGQRVAFLSCASNLLGSGSTARCSHIYVYDVPTQTMVLASPKAGSATLRANGASSPPKLSADGQRVVFSSCATDLVVASSPLDSSCPRQIYLYDLETKTMRMVSHAFSSTTQGADGESYGFALSGDGRRVAFSSCARDLIADYEGPEFSDQFVCFQIYVYNLDTQATTLVSHASGSVTTGGNRVTDYLVEISADGQRVAFGSCASDLLDGYSGAACQVYAYDLSAQRMILLSRSRDSATSGGNEVSYSPAISADGKRIGFLGCATDLVVGYSGSGCQLYLYDEATQAVTLISRANATTAVAANGDSEASSISADGRRVAFVSAATDLVASYSGSTAPQVYVYDLTSQRTTLASHAAGLQTTGGDAGSGFVAISPDGGAVVFSSAASNLSAIADNNMRDDVFYLTLDDLEQGGGSGGGAIGLKALLVSLFAALLRGGLRGRRMPPRLELVRLLP